MDATSAFADNVGLSFAKSTGGAEAAIDPATVSVIIQLIGAIAPMVQQCLATRAAKNAAAAGKTPAAQVKEWAASPNLWQKVALNNQLRETLGFRGFAQHGRKMAAALLDTTSKASDTDIQQVLDEH